MPALRLVSANDTLDLSSVEYNGYGVQVRSGVTGLGLPPVQGQWLEGAGDGARFRGSRVLSRDIDLPLLVQGRTRDELKGYVTRLAKMFSAPCTLYFTDDRNEEWTAIVARVGGGDFSYGEDTRGERDMFTIVTVRAGDPYFTSTVTSAQTIAANSGTHGLLDGGSLTDLDIAPSQAIGSITFTNTGDAKAYPVWTIKGPGNNFKAVSVNGETLWWTGSLGTNDTLTIDCKKGTVTDQTGANRYSELAAKPVFWSVPPGVTTCTAQLQSAIAGQSSITASWQARKWVVI